MFNPRRTDPFYRTREWRDIPVKVQGNPDGSAMTARVQTIQSRISTIDTRSARSPAKTGDAFYSSREWRTLMAEIIAERGRRCQDSDCPRPHPPLRQIYGDHIIELKDGGARLDKANVLLRCASAHTRKTMRERAKRTAQRY